MDALAVSDAGAVKGKSAAVPLSWRLGLSYGGLAAPLAFVSLPLYVQLPHYYAAKTDASLAALGAVLLATRGLDALVDPLIGRWADRRFSSCDSTPWRTVALGSVMLVLGFAALWHPPSGPAGAVLAWLLAALLVTSLSYSAVVIVHQSWGARWGGSPAWRARLGAWREGASLAGVLLASALPAWAGLDATSMVLAAGLALGLIVLRKTGPGSSCVQPMETAPQGTGAVRSPWSDAAFRSLLAVYLLNGVAAALPATLLPFFVADLLQAPAQQPVLLLGYFGAAALGLPLWVRLVARRGLAPAWGIGMLTSALAFGPTLWLSAGDGTWFLLICVVSGLALGADLALPTALLTGVIRRAGAGRQSEGHYLGWWACATKLNLALAAGLALPLLQMAGYHAGTNDPSGLRALAWAYGGMPVLLRLAAAALLWRIGLRQSHRSLLS